MKYKLKLPDSKQPGFLKRKREFMDLLMKWESQKGFDEYVEYVAQYVEADEPIEAVLEMSRDEISKINAAFLYGREPDPEA